MLSATNGLPRGSRHYDPRSDLRAFFFGPSERKSIEDQAALCRDVCAREGMAVVLTFEDRAISDTATANRPGFQSLMRAAEAKLFDVLVIEDVDRLSRDQGDYHSARKRFDFLGINIHAAAGKVGKLDGALRALKGEMFIEDLVLHEARNGWRGARWTSRWRACICL
ncbi:recombinase family protein [Bradyrhizobium sp. 166]|uniref:recombinase family protein n=1 Tax=Bradyrhizobium sp. 166 TaxID=2782638 RepID=UPI001FFB0B8C|nr:recombinase family protein [Bradyrhizobium sp. 166]